MLFFDSLTKDIVGVVVTLVVVVIAYYKWSYQYWKRKNVPFLEPSFPFGNTTNPLTRTETLGVTIQKVYQEMKNRNWKHGGIYLTSIPAYCAIDLEYVKNIMTKDFQYFVDRGSYYNEKDDPLSAHLFAIGGSKWRNLRTKLTPTFTSGKMRQMFQTLVDCESSLLKKIELEYSKKSPIDIKEVLGCFTTDIIGSCAFGLECKTFEQENSPFRVYGKKLFQGSTSRNLKRTLLTQSFPDLARKLGVLALPEDVSNFFMKVVNDSVSYREKNSFTRNDFLQLLINLKNSKIAEEEGYQHDGKTLTLEEIAAQCFVFFLAGFETSSTTMTFALYEMAKNQEIQNKVREEISTVLKKHDGKITYESIQDMKYMNQVIDETLRKYPPVPFVTRKCIADYKIPDEDIVIDKGTTVMIPILGIHYDKDYYPNPEKFDPERFTEENKNARHHYAHIPFGEGPRICIGMRFGLMQSKVGLTSLLKNYKFTVSKKTKEPLKMQVQSFILAAEGEVWLDAHKL
ncbi:cytochrome P450 6a2-like [Tribolium madens]|uniref:cytochrome P450 6a2-like n=1 Tax=Tribolium madens TaxID=41895 RepID=UPI001CF73BE1|nr:cytochrome P450 6a2-like [Tribolium madens]